jgi:uncharacterized membrane protein
MDPHVRELLDLVIRWVHVIAGIMWIGNSMLFNWLDRNLVKKEGAGEGHEGEIWMVHSGGFYQVEKKQLAPSEMPAMLHWFKWQNGITWISGIFLLGVVYYLGGGAYLLDPSISKIGFGPAVALSLGTIIGTWALYDLLWKTVGKRAPIVAAAISLAYVVGVSYGLLNLLSGRAAFLHVGVMLGTLMTGNVWMVIMPSQRELIAQTLSGQRQATTLAKRAKERSIHNNYMTFPLLFIMVSNHYPSTYGSGHAWLTLAVIAATGAGVRHLMNIRFYFAKWIPVLSAIVASGLVALFFLTAPKKVASSRPADAPPVAFKTVRSVVNQRCVPCHSQSPTDDTWKTAPAGIMLDTPEQVKAMASRIKERVVITRNMPLGNKTQITDGERELLGDWIDQGAKVD